jgi:hypothetical protein
MNPTEVVMSGPISSRRRFVVTMLAPAVFRLAKVTDGWSSPVQSAHPEPRAGIDASKVLKRDALRDHPDAIPVFDMVRQIPQIADGIRCSCGCAEAPGYYSLLSCFEGDGMAGQCQLCQGQARLAFRLHREGKSLKEIRKAIDKEFG